MPAPRDRQRLDELVALSLEMGDPARDLTILAEGNTSARIDDGAFWVKASGVRLEHADGPHAFVAVASEPLLDALRGGDLSEAQAKAVLRGARLDGQDAGVPSIETYVHAICVGLGGAAFVAHTHPTAVNALLCARDAERLYAGVLFPDEAVVCGPRPLLVPYAAPGLALGRAMLGPFVAHLERHGAPPRVVLLRNHGLVALGATAGEAAAITAMVVKAARIRLGTLAAGGPVFLPDEQASGLFAREDEVERRELLARGAGG
jgi:rhamnose utilization protein RhaD (predicted bifunctional aldolase and dehydrogenase)